MFVLRKKSVLDSFRLCRSVRFYYDKLLNLGLLILSRRNNTFDVINYQIIINLHFLQTLPPTDKYNSL